MARHERVRLLRRRARATGQHGDPQPYEPHEETLPKIWDSLFSPLLAAHLYLLFDFGRICLAGFDANGRDQRHSQITHPGQHAVQRGLVHDLP